MKITRNVFYSLMTALLLISSTVTMAQEQKQGQKPSKAQIQAVKTVRGAISFIYNMNEQNYQNHLNHAKRFFTKKGWKELDMANTKLVKAVKNGDFSLSTQFNQNQRPRVGRDTEAGQPTWIVQLPFTAVYKGDFKDNKKQHMQSLMASAKVVQKQKHMKIERLLVQHMKGPQEQTQQSNQTKTQQQPQKRAQGQN